MAATTNAQEKQELFKTIWKIADDLRGKVDGWDFKAYVLGTLFYRYLSENIADRINKQEQEAGDEGFDYASLTDDDVKGVDGFREELIKEIGFFLYPSELFCNVTGNATADVNLNMTLEQVFRNVENSAKGSESEKCFEGLFSDYDVNSNKLGATVQKRNETLAKLLVSVRDMDFGNYTDNTVDLLGDAYEYLMGMYASNAGKSGGEYFTPQEVSTLLTKIAILGKDRVNKVYDPACGSGSLLLKSAKILGKDKVDQGYFGQEINVTTYNLCRINMFLHNIGYDKFDIANEDTLTQPMHWDEEPFDVIVSNPPYSVSWVGDDDVTMINDPRFSPAGVLAPKGYADFAFIMHSLSWLAPSGTAAIVCYPGIFYRSGTEQKIRQYLVDNNYIDAIIQLGGNLFYGTPVATCIMILKKNKKDNNILFINAGEEYIKDVNSNRLSEDNISNILNYYIERSDEEFICKVVSYDEIKENKYDLSIPTYIPKENKKGKIEIEKLDVKVKEIVEREKYLYEELDKLLFETDGLTFDKLIEEKCPDGVPEIPLYKVTIWDKKFKEVEKYKQPKIIKYKVMLAADLFALEQESGDVFLLSTGEQTGWTTEELAGDKMQEGEVVTIPWGKSRPVVDCVKYYKGKFVTGDNRIMTSNDTDLLDNRYLYHCIIAKGDIIDTFYRGSGLKHPSMSKMLDLEIPIPPKTVQEEIVRVLDKYEELTEELNIILKEEVSLRQQQRDYYREKALKLSK